VTHAVAGRIELRAFTRILTAPWRCPPPRGGRRTPLSVSAHSERLQRPDPVTSSRMRRLSPSGFADGSSRSERQLRHGASRDSRPWASRPCGSPGIGPSDVGASAFTRAAIFLRYSPIADAAASANGLPSESRHTAHRSPGWTSEPPSSRTRSSVPGRSATVKYGREAVSPGPGPRSWTPKRRLSVSACHPDPAAAGRGERATPRTPCQNRSARSASSAGNSMSGAGIDASMAGGSCSLGRCAKGGRSRGAGAADRVSSAAGVSGSATETLSRLLRLVLESPQS
jgi:hypothetical protein